jgi:hypothetical protein
VNNYDAYAALPDALKSPQDRTAATVPTSSDNTNGREGPLNVRRWLNETGLWGFIPEDVRQRSNARIAQWLETDRPDLWTQFTAWLESRLPGRARPDPVEEEPTRFDSPPVSDVRGGRFASIDARTFVRSFWDSVVPANTDMTAFKVRLMIRLQQMVSGPHRTITVGDFLAAVRASAENVFDPNTAARLNSAMERLLPPAAPTATPNVVAGEIGSETSSPRPSSSSPGSFGANDILSLASVLNALSP